MAESSIDLAAEIRVAWLLGWCRLPRLQTKPASSLWGEEGGDSSNHRVDALVVTNLGAVPETRGLHHAPTAICRQRAERP